MSIIYEPRGQAGEYSPLALNIYRGCGHACAYCYVPRVLKMDRREFDANAECRKGFSLRQLQREADKFAVSCDTDQVMLSFTSDPYHPFDNRKTRESLRILRSSKIPFCTLTKGGTRSLRDIDMFSPSRDSFATTLTSLDNAFSIKWERGAALPADRLEALQRFHEAGIYTWVSLEPTLDTESSLAIVDATHEFVDLYKVGRANYLPMTKTTDWESYTHRMIEKMASLGKEHYIKHDLQPYLPEGYYNPVRRIQHH